jgi:hypothetical protein
MENTLKQIAVGLSGSKLDKKTSEFVGHLAQRTGASVDAYLIRPMPDDPQLLMTTGFLGDAFRHLVEQAEKTIIEFDQTARQAFENGLASFTDVKAHYHNPHKDISREFATVVWGSDIAVMAHPALVNMQYYKMNVLDAIADSGRPVLLLPEEKKVGDFKHMLVVWRADTRHAQALAAALPVLQLAEEVTLLSHEDEDCITPGGDVAVRYLSAHGVNVNNVVIKGEERFTLSSIDNYCDKHDVSVLVIGGGLQSDLVDSFVSGIGRRASRKPARAILALG